MTTPKFSKEDIENLRLDLNDFLDAATQKKRADADLIRNLDVSYARRSRRAVRQAQGRAETAFDAYFEEING